MFRSLLSKCPGLHQRSSVWQSTQSKMLSTAGDSVTFAEVNKAGVITLNRPKALNALNIEMVRRIYPTMLKWQNTKSLVIIKSDLEKAFCAGGDVRALAVDPLEDSVTFLREEYTLNHLISTYRVPYVALINGITMGGGVGLSVHGKYRVATEKTMFAMPETLIGLFPDVGGGYFLPRLAGQLGMYLGLTGDRLKGRDVLFAGVATHFCEYARLGELEAALLTCSNTAEIEATLSKFCPVDKNARFSLEPQLQKINEYFSADSVEEILAHLEKDNTEWSSKLLKLLHAASPMSLKVSHHQIRTGRNLSLADVLKMEIRLGQRHIDYGDFREGVRAMIIDKDNAPKWQYTSVKDAPDAKMLEYFRPFDDSKLELVLPVSENSKL